MTVHYTFSGYAIVTPSVIRMADIQRIVAQFYGLNVEDMRSPTRLRSIAHPRQLAMYLCRRLAKRSSGEVADKFDRDHTTVLYGVKAVQERMAKDPAYAREVRHVTALIEERRAA